MAQLIQRVAQYLANEVITKSLARSKMFQNFAQRTHGNVEKFSEASKKHTESIDMNKVAENAGVTIGRFMGNASTFAQTMSKNASKSLADAQKVLADAQKNAPK
ncbi:hypothetical protein SARC_11042 [Sphaeroforma arctica JP610]|uniref:Uncharacterized protein n=1 Tax=Sphaeroforma arctica JP610 TaxID=667725 RepID=A0A0L0FK98_9EUKA|nr:hypothetical protein SARC_11042 [Sphaeroforma arctica JP610]KNC76458.1 hypothetical protein SARC_11042 [Sphaeroforma arctica JP610]|eukprot:XP_014150360.1 hypothetical protein SARC_11042 [Sphaeroforma arctica JP610]